MVIPSASAIVVLEHASDAVFVTSDQFGIEWVNEAAVRLLGYPREQLIGRNIADIVVPEELASVPLRGPELRAGVRLVTERTLRRADGSTVKCEVSSGRLPDGRLVGFTRDVTARVEAAERLRRSEESFRSLAEKLPDAIAIHRSGKFVFCNRVMLETLGYTSADELVGTPVMNLVHPESRKAVAERLAALARGESEVPWLEERILRRDGSSLIMEIGAIQIVFEDEPSIVVVGRDVTERKAMQLRLAEADRMASIGTLAAGIAHEINNPLTYVTLKLEAAKRMLAGVIACGGTLGIDAISDLIDKIAAAIEGTARVGDIVTGLRRFARDDESPRGPIEIARAIDAAVRLVDHERRVRARLVREDHARQRVEAHEGRMTQVFVNLLANAIHAIPEGRADEHVVTIRSWDDGPYVRVAVSDTGVGIRSEALRRVFDPFFTTKDPGAGVGLGLAICHGIVTAYGGTIEVDSTPGAGTTFTVTLPATAGELHEPETRAVVGAPPARRYRVLVVDDEPMIRSAAAEVLDSDYEVELIASGRAAITRLSEGVDVDAIVCDLTMPDVSGADVLRWIETHRPGLADRMIFTSGGNHELATRFPDRWLAKPFSFDGLKTMVDARISATHGQRVLV